MSASTRLRLAPAVQDRPRAGAGDVRADESVPAGAETTSSSTSSSATACCITRRLPARVPHRRPARQARRAISSSASTAPTAASCTTPDASLFRLTGITSPWLDPHFRQDRRRRQARGLVPGSVLPSARDVAHDRRSAGAGWTRTASTSSTRFPSPCPVRCSASHERLFEPRDAGTALSRMLSQLAQHGQRLSRGRLLHHDRPATSRGAHDRSTASRGGARRHGEDAAPVRRAVDGRFRRPGRLAVVCETPRNHGVGSGRRRAHAGSGRVWYVRRSSGPSSPCLVAITTPIGRVVSLILLAAMFYGVFTPLAILFSGGSDAMRFRSSVQRDLPTGCRSPRRPMPAVTCVSPDRRER